MADEYAKYLVKEYTYWSIYVAQNQGYLGRCVIWCKREDALDLAHATADEQQELFKALQELQTACSDLFKPDWFNYAFLGNETRHLHGHFIPRYKEAREFQGTNFTDTLFGKNYKTDATFITPDPIILGVRDAYRHALR